ncbi:hypothetical protein [Bacillus sp. V59.32b]|uniref:hypothetical protein n=1 Tax=Bacillus sp. V59.32b TaxID=1758642 RepID=UPI00135C8FC7|nr:hypothetical protein [Bacillus sp. V59.32b]
MSFTATSKRVLSTSHSKKKYVWITKGSLVDNRYIWRTGRSSDGYSSEMYF